MTTLMHAFNQYMTRGEDESYKSLAAIHEAALADRRMAREAKQVGWNTLRVLAEGGDLALVGKANVPSKLTHFAFGQLAGQYGLPTAWLRTRPATLAAQEINHDMAKDTKGLKTNVLLQQNGEQLVRGFSSDIYTRIWNSDITGRLLRLSEEHPEWQPAPEGFNGSRGLYKSQDGRGDLFCFLVDSDRRIFESDPNGGLGRGFFVDNQELPGKSVHVWTFLYEYCCGNHRVVGATNVTELAIRHTGKADDQFFAGLTVELKKYAEGSAEETETQITQARSYILGNTKDEVLDKVFGLRIPELGRGVLTKSYELAEKRESWYGAPNTVWGLTGGITEIARDLPFQDERVALDRAAGKLMQVAF